MSCVDKDKERAAKRRSYEKHKDVVKARTAARKKSIRDRNRVQLERLLADSECADCSIDYWVVLEFDHLEEKSHGIATMMTDYEWSDILNEIGKCEIVCSNCHRIRTYERSESWRVKPAPRE